MSCRNCNGSGGRMVPDGCGESTYDPCFECGAWDKKMALSRRAQTACQALRLAGYECSMVRETILVKADGIQGWAMDVVPAEGDQRWFFHLSSGVVPDVVKKQISIINKF